MAETDLKQTRLDPAKGRFSLVGLVYLAVLAFCGYSLFTEGGMEGWWFVDKVATVLGTIICVIAVAYCGVRLLPRAWYLELGPEDFTYCSLYVRHRYSWQDVSQIRFDLRPNQDWVSFDLIRKESARGFERIHRAWSHREYKSDGYAEGRFGMTPQALADLMNTWRERHLAGKA